MTDRQEACHQLQGAVLGEVAEGQVMGSNAAGAEDAVGVGATLATLAPVDTDRTRVLAEQGGDLTVQEIWEVADHKW